MRTIRTVLVAMLAVFALGAVMAGAAEALEAPHWNFAGKRLGVGETKEVTSGSSPVNISFGDLSTKCSMALSPGVKVLGSSAGNPGLGEFTMELSKCTEMLNKCKIEHQPIKSEPLVGELVQIEEKGFEGPLALWIKPASKVGHPLFMKLELGACVDGSPLNLYGALAAKVVYEGWKPVEIGKEPAESKTVGLVFPHTQISAVEPVSGGVDYKQKVVWEYKLAGAEGAAGTETQEGEPSAPLVLTSTMNWGVFD
jgi:hypothetical protein